MSENIHSAIQEEILRQAIQKAINNDFKPWFSWPYNGQIDEEGLGYDSEYGYIIEVAVSDIIFNHDFAKALWKMHYPIRVHDCSYEVHEPAWSYHLKKMVMQPDPIKYLGENI